MGLLLDLAYGAGVLAASPYVAFKLATDGNWRRGLGERFGGAPRREPGRPCVWIHCASVGEVALSRPLVRELAARRPDLEFDISVTTPAGRQHAGEVHPGRRVHFWPLDFGFAVRRALRRVRPDAVVLVELEVWPNFVQAAAGRGIPVGIVNGRMSRRSHRRYRRATWFFRRVFRRLAALGMQDRSYADRIAEFGVPSERIAVTGNLKYDAALGFDPDAARAEIRSRWGVAPDAPLLVAGSTHDPEEGLLLAAVDALRARHPGLRLLVAPRHVERADEVEKLLAASGRPVARRSRLAGPPPADALLLLDTVGELARTYAAADAVYIGGTFCARGGQNMLEPAVLGKPVVSGPSLENFEEIAGTLARAGGLVVLDHPAKLEAALDAWFKDPAAAREAGRKGREAVESGRGALAASVDLVLRLLDAAPRRS